MFGLHVCVPHVCLILPVEVRRGVRPPRTGVRDSFQSHPLLTTHTQTYKENQEMTGTKTKKQAKGQREAELSVSWPGPKGELQPVPGAVVSRGHA